MGPDNTKVVARVETVSDTNSSSTEGQPQRPRRDVKGAVKTIVVGVALPCTPVIIITAILLSFVFNNRIDRWPGHQELLSASASAAEKNLWNWWADFRKSGGPAFFVDRNASTITTIAQWTSKVLPYLTSSIMALVAFFAARSIVLNSRRGQEATLLTSEQLTLLINLLGGSGTGPLLDTLKFWQRSKQRLPKPLPAVFWSLLTITGLGLAIPAIDSWFGVTTTAVPVVIFSNTTTTQAYGRQVDRYANSTHFVNGTSPGVANGSVFWPWDIGVDNGYPDFVSYLSLNNAIEALRLDHNVSTATMLRSVAHGPDQYFFYVDTRPAGQLDFQASSPAVTTQCIPMTQKCLNGSSDGSFACSTGFSGDLTRAYPDTLYRPASNSSPEYAQDQYNLGLGFSTTAELLTLPPLMNLNDLVWVNQSYPSFLLQNPQYFGAWAKNYPDQITLRSSPLSNDSEIASFGSDSTTEIVWFLNCSFTVANATYTVVNGSLQSFDPVVMDDHEMAALFTAPFNFFPSIDVVGTSLVNMATVASLASTADELATIWADEFSKTALSMANGVVVPLNNSLQQDRNIKIVAKVPKIPFFLLIGLKLLYVLAVVLLAVAAYAFTQPAETEVVMKQLSTKGLATAYFNTPGLLRQNAVDAVKGLTGSESVTDQPEKQKVTTEVREVQVGEAPKIGLLPDAQGVWNFAVQADGVWHSIQPILNILADSEVKKLGLV